MNINLRGLVYRCPLFFMMALLLVSCASSRIIESWHDSNNSRGKMQRIFVVAVMKDEMRRRVWEDTFIKNLSPMGVTVIPSYRIFPKSAPKEADLREYIRDNTFSGVFIIKKSGERTESYIVPGTTSVRLDSYPSPAYRPYGAAPYGYGPGPYWGYYGDSYVVEHTPAHTVTERIVSYEASLWDAAREGDGELAWKGKSETVDPSSREAMTEELAKLFVSRLQADGII